MTRSNTWYFGLVLCLLATTALATEHEQLHSILADAVRYHYSAYMFYCCFGSCESFLFKSWKKSWKNLRRLHLSSCRWNCWQLLLINHTSPSLTLVHRLSLFIPCCCKLKLMTITNSPSIPKRFKIKSMLKKLQFQGLKRLDKDTEIPLLHSRQRDNESKIFTSPTEMPILIE